MKMFRHGGCTRANGRSSPEYRAWRAAKTRCYNVNDPNYERYGARGIRMCDEWLHDFSAFIGYIGPRPTTDHSLDRIDVNGHYEPGNVRWATWSEQCGNRRNTRRVTIGGETKSLAEWSRLSGVRLHTLMARHRKGRPIL